MFKVSLFHVLMNDQQMWSYSYYGLLKQFFCTLVSCIWLKAIYINKLTLCYLLIYPEHNWRDIICRNVHWFIKIGILRMNTFLHYINSKIQDHSLIRGILKRVLCFSYSPVLTKEITPSNKCLFVLNCTRSGSCTSNNIVLDSWEMIYSNSEYQYHNIKTFWK
jgi:hypothetical protein